MKITTERYSLSINKLPKDGQRLVAHYNENKIVVYQAYKPAIAEYAVKNQCLGGPDFSYNRMSWIKPNFLWMMFRCGWATKDSQERVLALWIGIRDFESILENAVFSSFNSAHYESHDDWRKEIESKEVRLQWDPDHDPYGNKIARRAIQIGLKGQTLENFGKTQIISIEDITDFVQVQKENLDKNGIDELSLPVERVFDISNDDLKNRIGLS